MTSGMKRDQRGLIWDITLILIIVLLVSLQLNQNLALRVLQNQQYEYLYNCSGVSEFSSATEILYPNYTVTDSRLGSGYFTAQLNVATAHGSSPGPEIQVVALAYLQNGSVYLSGAVQVWFARLLLSNQRGPQSPGLELATGDQIVESLAHNSTVVYNASFEVKGETGAILWRAPLNFDFAESLAMVSAQSGMYGFSNDSRATFLPLYTPLFRQMLTASSGGKVSTVGDRCDEGEDLTAETSNMLMQDVTAVPAGIQYTLYPVYGSPVP